MHVSAQVSEDPAIPVPRAPHPIRTWGDRVSWLLVLSYHFALGAIVGLTLLGCVAQHTALRDSIAAGIGGLLYLWNARAKGYI